MSVRGSDGAGDLDVATRTQSMDEALARAYAAFDELHQSDPKRLAMREWLIEFERRRQQPDGGIRLELPDRPPAPRILLIHHVEPPAARRTPSQVPHLTHSLHVLSLPVRTSSMQW